MSFINHYNQNNITYFKAKNFFLKPIPFKVYCLQDQEVSGRFEHVHDYIQIWYIVNGCCKHWINSQYHSLTRGSIFVLPPYTKHKIQLIDKQHVQIIGCEFVASFINEYMSQPLNMTALFDFAYLEPFLVSTELVRPRLHLTGQAQAKVESLLWDMLEEFNNEKKYYDIHIKADLLKLLAIITREYENCIDLEYNELFHKYRDAINAAIQYIHQNYTHKLYMEDICKIAMMSQSYFSQLFKQITGKTFIEYINDLRIRAAIEMLMNSRMSITNICYSVGFNDLPYFNKVFKKETGLSPSKYRTLSSNKK